MKLELIHYILAFLGLLLYFLTSILKAKRTHKQDFNLDVWLQDNFVSLLASIISVLVLMLSADDFINFNLIPKQFSGALKLISVMFGYFNFSILKKLFDIWRPKKLRKK